MVSSVTDPEVDFIFIAQVTNIEITEKEQSGWLALNIAPKDIGKHKYTLMCVLSPFYSYFWVFQMLKLY